MTEKCTLKKILGNIISGRSVFSLFFAVIWLIPFHNPMIIKIHLNTGTKYGTSSGMGTMDHSSCFCLNGNSLPLYCLFFLIEVNLHTIGYAYFKGIVCTSVFSHVTTTSIKIQKEYFIHPEGFLVS
jgi:hypothetical protein